MEQSLTAWLLPALALVAGVAIGFLIARLLPNAAPNKVQRQMDDLQDRFDSYQREVVTHFNTTASLVKKLTQSYQDVRAPLRRRPAPGPGRTDPPAPAGCAACRRGLSGRAPRAPDSAGLRRSAEGLCAEKPGQPRHPRRHLRPERQVLTRCANLPTPMKKPRIRGAFSWLRDDQIAWRSRNRSSTCFTPSSTLSAWVSITRSASSGTS